MRFTARRLECPAVKTATFRTSIISSLGTGHQNPGIGPAAFFEYGDDKGAPKPSAAAAKPESRKF